MSSNRSDLPPELGDAFALVGPRLGRLGATILYFQTVGSTNDVALCVAGRPDGEGTVVIAEAQTSGRGRRGRTWYSPPASGLYVSIVTSPWNARDDSGRATSLLTLAAGVAVARAIETCTGLTADLKWPNDLYVGRRKLAGILAESAEVDGAPRGARNVVVGYGINTGPINAPPELADRVTSIEAELGRPVDRAMLCAESVAAVAAVYDDLLQGRFDAILDDWRRRAPASRGARVSWRSPEGLLNGITAGIDDRGALLVAIGDRLERIVAGELTWH